MRLALPTFNYVFILNIYCTNPLERNKKTINKSSLKDKTFVVKKA